MRRWYRAVTQYCPGLQFDANQTIEHQPWECHLLKLGIEQNQMRLTQAKRVISMSLQEVLFALFSHSDLSSCWFSRKHHPIALLEIQEFLPPAQNLWEQWQEMGLEQICPDQVPVLKQPLGKADGEEAEEAEEAEVGSGSLGIRGKWGDGEVGRWGDEESHLLRHASTQNSLSALTQFVTGDQTIWDIAMQVKQPVTAVASALMTLAEQDVLALQTVPDFPVPVEVTSSMPTHSSISAKPLATIDEVVVTDKLAHQLQACVKERFTGRLDIEDAQVQQWSFYFHLGNLTGCSSQVHPLRRWCRQLSVHCPQLQNAVSGQEVDLSSCWDYTSLAALVSQGEVLQEQIAAVVEGYVTEVLFDLYQQSERLHYRSEQITYRRIPYDTTDNTEVTLVSIAAPLQVQQQVLRNWEAWQRAGLVDCFPNLAPVILQPEELRRQTSPYMYQHLTALVAGNLTLRDLAVKLQQHLLPLTQSIMPYIHQGLMGLTEVGDFSCVMPPPNQPGATVQSHTQLEQGETMSALIRPELGDFSSIICFKAVITGMEDALGEKATAIALISAGRARGRKLADELGLTGATGDLPLAGQKLGEVLGKSGTRLCKIEKVDVDGDAITVYTSETVCSAGEEPGSPRKCTFTLGAVWGALEQVLGKRLQGKHTGSVLRGGNYDVFEFTALERA